MTSIKTVLLGSAAAIVATGAAQAADLPVKKAAAAVQYVEVCPAFGRGFYKLPGTDICIRHFGYVKAEFFFKGADDAIAFFHNSGGDYIPFVFTAASHDTVGYRVSARPGWDFRSPTEFGTLRTVVQLRNDRTSGLGNGLPPADASSNTATRAQRAYIQWAGFTVGIAASQFIYWDQDDVIASIGGDPKQTVMMVTYEFPLPIWPGVTATIGLENPNYQTPATVYADVDVLGGGAEFAVGPERMWDVVATLSQEQSWGSWKLAGVVHQISVIPADPLAGLNGKSCVANIPGNNVNPSLQHCMPAHETGWAGLAGITFNLPQLGAGDQLLLQAAYAEGASVYAGLNGGANVSLMGGPRDGIFADGLLLDYGDVFVLPVGGAGGNAGNLDIVLDKNRVLGTVAQLKHYWTPMWRSNFMVGYTEVHTSAGSCAESLISGGRCSANALDVAANLIWGKSRQTAEIGVEVLYKKVHQTLPAGGSGAGGVAIPPEVDEDPDLWYLAAFIQRSW